ncbi:glycosyltransferase family A protein [Streptomyces sp. NPDC093111]|uniref:glycosyltransferase family 2 protein n=1 Tax=Streptomyces sp. NPDC093111 TaxID=3154978 RepID=UPI003436028F
MISVIIPTKDRPGPLHRALRSLARQTYGAFEVIVVRDGGSPVDHVLDSWTGTLPITLIDQDTTEGVSRARNRALDLAEGEYVAFLDDDDIFLPGHLRAAADALAAGDVSAVYGRALVSPTWLEALPQLHDRLPRKDYAFDAGFLSIANFIHTGSVVLRNPAATPVRFDETMNHCEDWNFWLDLHRTAAYRFQLLGHVTCVYHQVPRPGAVTLAYEASPTPFTAARALIYERWPATTPLDETYREWFRAFDSRLDACIADGLPTQPHVYEHAVRGLHPGYTAGRTPSRRLLDTLFPAVSLGRTGTSRPMASAARPGGIRALV